MLKPLFHQPAGPSEIFSIGQYKHGTTAAVICQMCGTSHPELPLSADGYRTFTFLGYYGVLECCGVVVDRLFQEWGSTFTDKIFKQFQEQLLAPEFGLMRIQLKDVAAAWNRAAAKAEAESAEYGVSLRGISGR